MKKTNSIYVGRWSKYKIFVLAFLFMFVQSSAIFAQNITVKGTVKDSYGTALPGVFVSEKNGSATTSSAADGSYQITVAPNATLVFTFIGMQTQEVPVNNRAILEIVLDDDAQMLQESVAVGYGVQKKSSLTAAVATVDTKVLESRPIPDVGRGLQGTTPGLTITIPSGEVGSDPVIRIRGQIGSLESTNNAPLILLDNVEIPSLQMVNTDDIESISILKDAAAASIYGTKGAYGVVLITTKKGSRTESVSVSYTGSLSFQNISKKMEMAQLEGMEYSVLAMERAKATVAGAFIYVSREGYEKAVTWNQKYAGKIGKNDPYTFGRDWYRDANGRKIGLRTYDPYDYMIREWAPTQEHKLSINGKSGSTSYILSASYLDQSGIIKPSKSDDFKRYNGRVHVSTDVNKWLSVYGGALYSRRVKEYAYATNSTTADPWLYLYRWASTYPMGEDNYGNPIRSPYFEMGAANTAYQETSYASMNAGITITPLKDWKVMLDYTWADQNYTNKRPGTRFTAADTWVGPVVDNYADGTAKYVNDNGDVVDASTPGAIRAYKLNYYTYTAEGANPDHVYQRSQRDRRSTLQLKSTYDWQINDDHGLNFLVGMERIAYEYTMHWNQTTKLVDYENPQFDLATGTQTGSGDEYWDALLGFFGRVNYNFREKYLLEANLRYDGTSKFPSGLQWRLFPSVSAGWRVTQEPWMEWSRDYLPSLKLRGSYGVIGDQSVPNSLYIPTMGGGTTNWLIGSEKLFRFTTPSAVSPSVTWQEMKTLDLGLEARFLRNGALGLTFNWYQKDLDNMIVPQEGIPATFGATAAKSNYGSFRTRGIELELDYSHRFDFGLGMNFKATLSDYTTKVTAYGSTTSVDDWYVGKTYGEIWGFETDRLYQASDFAYNASGNLIQITKGSYKINQLTDPNAPTQGFMQSGNFYYGPGDVKYKDLDGSGEINDGSRTLSDHGDMKIIGNSTPRYEYSFTVGADYKGFDLNVFMQGVGKRDVWGEGFLAIPGFNSADGAMPAAFAKDFWREDRTSAKYPRPWNLGGSMPSPNNKYNTATQSGYLLNMAYFRIKNITVGYTLPQSLLSKVNISKLRVYVSLENFFTFDHLGDLPIDPEAISGYSMWNTDNYNSGRTGVGVPTYKTVSMGIQLNF